jgi:hypothetical protein
MIMDDATTDAAAAQIRHLRQEVDEVMRITITQAFTNAVDRAAIATQRAGEHYGYDVVAGNVRERPLHFYRDRCRVRLHPGPRETLTHCEVG